MEVVTDESQMQQYSSPEQIAEVVYEAATDGTISCATSLAPMRKQRT
jgi:hypothetical protein